MYAIRSYYEAIFDALAERMADGVRVYMIVDSASYYRTYPMDAEPIPASTPLARALGIPLIEYNPIRGRRIFTLLGLLDRDHRKFWVVDGRTVVTGGQNVDYDSLRDVGSGGCVDAMIEYDSPGAAAFLRDSFVRTWNAYSLDRLDPGDFSAGGIGASTGSRSSTRGCAARASSPACSTASRPSRPRSCGSCSATPP